MIFNKIVENLEIREILQSPGNPPSTLRRVGIPWQITLGPNASTLPAVNVQWPLSPVTISYIDAHLHIQSEVKCMHAVWPLSLPAAANDGGLGPLSRPATAPRLEYCTRTQKLKVRQPADSWLR